LPGNILMLRFAVQCKYSSVTIPEKLYEAPVQPLYLSYWMQKKMAF